MTTAKAIAALRERIGISQREFAETLGITIKSVSRYENGRKPSREVLKRLAALAEDAKLNDLRDIFAEKRKTDIVARIESLHSHGSERRVSVKDLKFTAAVARYIGDDLEKTLRRVGREFPDAEERYQWLVASLRNSIHYLGRQLEETELHIAEPWSFDRAEEDKQLLRRPWKSTSGLEGTKRKDRTLIPKK